MRFSSIDIGSNAIRQLIVEIQPNGAWKILKKHREPLRLGSDVFALGAIQPATLQKLILAFKRMARNNRKYRVDRYLAFATSALRDAENKKPVLSAILKQTKIKISIITGKKEADLIRQAVQHSLGLQPQNALLIDIGGGSIELTHLQNKKIHYAQSFKWGMVRTITQAQQQNCTSTSIVAKNIKNYSKKLPRGPFDLAIGTGGNLDAMAKLKLSFLKKGPNTLLTYVELNTIYHAIIATDAHLRAKKFNLNPDRIDVIIPALFLTLTLMKKYKIKKLKIPGTGLKEGAILSLLS